MKKVIIFLTVSLIICVCLGMGISYFSQTDKINIAVVNTADSIISENIFNNQLSQIENINLIYKQTTPVNQASVVTQLCENEEVSCIAVLLDKYSNADKIITAARSYNMPIIFFGQQPSQTILDNYDKCWYVGSNYSYAGELLGKLCSNAYRNSIIADTNQNYMIDTATFFDASDNAYEIIDSFKEQLEYSGYYTSLAGDFLAFTREDSYALETDFYTTDGTVPEAYICINADVADGVINALLDLNAPMVSAAANDGVNVFDIPDSNNSKQTSPLDTQYSNTTLAQAYYPILCTGYNQSTYLHIQNGYLLGCVVYNSPVAAKTILILSRNIAMQNSPTLDINLAMDENKTIFVPYITIDRSNLENQSWIKD